jgi:hypothetical protein
MTGVGEGIVYLIPLLMLLKKQIHRCMTSMINFFSFQEEILLEPMFETPRSDITTVIVTPDAVSKSKKVDYIRRSRTKPKNKQTFEEIISQN